MPLGLGEGRRGGGEVKRGEKGEEVRRREERNRRRVME